MLNTIYIAAQIVSKTKLLHRSTAKGKQALNHYAKIVELMRNDQFDNVELISKRTKYGELRVQNCIKYDLGAGYRLITIKKEDLLFLQFLGSHDEADSWLNLNKGFIPCPTGNCYPLQYSVTSPAEPPATDQTATEIIEDEYEERLLNDLDDKILQQIFSGICEQRSS
jgi:hypothetical protein